MSISVLLNVYHCLGSSQDRVKRCSSQEVGCLGPGGHSITSPREKAFLPTSVLFWEIICLPCTLRDIFAVTIHFVISLLFAVNCSNSRCGFLSPFVPPILLFNLPQGKEEGGVSKQPMVWRVLVGTLTCRVPFPNHNNHLCITSQFPWETAWESFVLFWNFRCVILTCFLFCKQH